MDIRKFSFKVSIMAIKVIIVVCLVMVLVKGASTAYYYGYSIFNDDGMEAEPGMDITVTIDRNASQKDIGKLLEESGLVENANVFWIQTMMVEKGSEMKPGRYELNTSMTAYEMINIMAANEEKVTSD